MLFYVLLLPLAFVLTMFIVNSDIDVLYKSTLAFVPIPTVLVGMLSEWERPSDDEI